MPIRTDIEVLKLTKTENVLMTLEKVFEHGQTWYYVNISNQQRYGYHLEPSNSIVLLGSSKDLKEAIKHYHHCKNVLHSGHISTQLSTRKGLLIFYCIVNKTILASLLN